MSIYIVKHSDKMYRFLLKDEYHYSFLKYWDNIRNKSDIDILDIYKTTNPGKGVLNVETVNSETQNLYELAEQFQTRLRLWDDYPLWWYIDTTTMTFRRIPQD